MFYMGIDLAWKEGNPSGMALINENREIIHCSCSEYKNEDFSSFINGLDEPVILSVDSPLQVKNEKGGRLCDSQLMRSRFNGKSLKVFATSRSYMNRHYGGIRGEVLLEILENQNGLKLGVTLMETFPSGIVLSLIPELWEKKYKISSRLKLAELKHHFKMLVESLKALGFKGYFPDCSSVSNKKEYKKAEDQIDGILCAVNSVYFSKMGSYHQFGNGENGFTVIAQSQPKKSER